MALPAGSKIGAAAVFAAGTPASIYFSWDHINYYEVERKVVNEDVSFTVTKTTTSGADNSWTVKVSANGDSDWGTAEDKYAWECTISGNSGLSIETSDLEIKLSEASGNTYEIRKELVKSCSQNRTTSSSKKVVSTFVFPEEANSENWFEYLFGPDILNEVEKAVLEDTVYFTTTENTDSSEFTIKSTAQSSNTNWISKSYSWSCIISPTSDSFKKTQLDEKIPTSSSETNKKAGKKRLVYACAKNRYKVTDKVVESKFIFPNKVSSGSESSYLFGS